MLEEEVEERKKGRKMSKSDINVKYYTMFAQQKLVMNWLLQSAGTVLSIRF